MEELHDDTLLGHDKKEFLKGQPVLATLFHYFMIILLGAIAFGLGGGFLVLIVARSAGKGSNPILSNEAIWTNFITGGSAMIIWLLFIYFRKIKPSVF